MTCPRLESPAAPVFRPGCAQKTGTGWKRFMSWWTELTLLSGVSHQATLVLPVGPPWVYRGSNLLARTGSSGSTRWMRPVSLEGFTACRRRGGQAVMSQRRANVPASFGKESIAPAPGNRSQQWLIKLGGFRFLKWWSPFVETYGCPVFWDMLLESIDAWRIFQEAHSKLELRTSLDLA